MPDRDRRADRAVGEAEDHRTEAVPETLEQVGRGGRVEP